MMTSAVALREADLRDAGECARIDGFVRGQGGATPFHLAGWSRAVERGCGQRARYLVAERAGGAVGGVLPLTAMRSPLFGRALVSCAFATDGGVLAGSDGAATALAEGAVRLAERLGCPSIELRGGTPPAGWSIDDESYLGFARPLAPTEDAELAAIPRKQRAEVRKALAADLQVAVGASAAALAEHYRVYAASVRNLGTPVFPARLFREVAAAFAGDADCLTIRHDGAAVASVLSLYLDGVVYPYWGGGTRTARELRANDRMYFALMAHARGQGCSVFDFGRSKAGTGPAAFKKNWGFEPKPLIYARYPAGGGGREINPLSPRYALMVRTWKRLPLPLANLVGPWISRGLG